MIFSMEYKCRAAQKKKYSRNMAIEDKYCFKQFQKRQVGRAEVENVICGWK